MLIHFVSFTTKLFNSFHNLVENFSVREESKGGKCACKFRAQVYHSAELDRLLALMWGGGALLPGGGI